MEQNEMLEFVKALSHADRLRVIGVLAQRPASVEEISETLGMPVEDAFQHLTKLLHGGVIMEQDNRWYIDTNRMENLSRRQFAGQARKAYEPAPHVSEKSRKVLAAYLNADGTIKQIPLQPGKLKVILDYVL